MATINLGSIKFNWKGTYAGGTAYVVDDVVSYSGSSYICKLASTGNLPTNGTYWDVMSQAGTNGTDVGTTITTQGDILYRDGSGLQRLGAGTSGQFLKTQGTGANPIWANNTAGVIQTVRYATGSNWQQSMSGSSFTQINNGATDFDVAITPSATGNSIMLQGQIHVELHPSASDYGGGIRIKRAISGGATDYLAIGNTHGSRPRVSFWVGQNSPGYQSAISWCAIDKSHNTTSAITYSLEMINHGSITASFNYHPNHGDGGNGYQSQAFSTIMAQELGHTVTDA